MQAKDLYIRITDKDGCSTVDVRRVWSEQLYLDTASQVLAKEGSTITKISQEEYQKSRGDK